ncbi:MAG: phosphatidylglycerophosphatase A [Deltaproteobacteria bacterium]|nr:phosphatidylglycerophosphatase A [Deltaproteobacteria bacterium]
MSNKAVIFLSTGFYTGYSPIAPGTVGTILGIPLGIFLSRFNTISQMLVIVILFFVFSFISGKAEEILGKKDASTIVCDEILGFLAAMFLIPYAFFNIIAVFFLFRLFDIWKPFPIRMIENRIKSGYGIILDDVIAGVYANAVLRIAFWVVER